MMMNKVMDRADERKTPSPLTRKILRVLNTLLGMGLGAAGAALGIRIVMLCRPGFRMTVGLLIGVYAAACLLMGLLFFLLSNRMVDQISRFYGYVSEKTEKMPVSRLAGACTGLIIGLVIAALCTTVVAFLGEGMFTTVFAAIMFVSMGSLGLQIGMTRGKELLEWTLRTRAIQRHHGSGSTSAVSRKESAAQGKLLDTSCLIDGRILEIVNCGFMEGPLWVTGRSRAELEQMKASGEAAREVRGQRGWDVLQSLLESGKASMLDERENDGKELLKVAAARQLPVVTCDGTVAAAAAHAGVQSLNINDLANALKPITLPGEEMVIRIVKAGKEPGQGVGYLKDGTMLVAEGAGQAIGRECRVVVTSALQTSAGRMIFARVKEESTDHL